MLKQVLKSLLFVSIAAFPLVGGAQPHILEQDNVLLFSGTANPNLAETLSRKLRIPLAPTKPTRFADGEHHIQLPHVRGHDVIILQSTGPSKNGSVNDNFMELLLSIDAAKRASASSITVIIPYFGYARQDRKSASGVPISAAVVAHLIDISGVDRVIAIDLHCGQIQGFFNNTRVPVDNLPAAFVFVPHIVQKNFQDLVIVSPDAGGVERAKRLRDMLALNGVESKFAILVKQRARAGVVDSVNLIGNVQGKTALIIDDMIDSGGTTVAAAKELLKFGAKEVHAYATHPVFSGKALETLGQAPITEVVVTDTLEIRGKMPENMVQLSVAPLLNKVLRRLMDGGSISELFASKVLE